ncbi:MAG: nicotinate phosphoribosyltransferase [Verrucomicrobia bacterium]|nr:nicotinate phosphoribosyltransferase [Verrucomicrobiota bacterium]
MIRTSPALLTDLYQLTMAYGYWRMGVRDDDAIFHLSFRSQPFNGGYTVACGLQDAMDYLEQFRFDATDLEYLASLEGSDGQPIFARAFLEELHHFEFGCDVDAVPEGTVVFPHEPLVQITGPLMQAQLFETALLNIINFQTLIATKAARVCVAAKGAPVLEFGLRRAQGPDGALAASRAAYIGGCAATSNVLAGKVFQIPVRGTHAHSWVMSFDDELTSFRAFAESMPGNCVLLVDTYNTLQGVHHAVEIGRWLRTQGKDLTAVRLDSGDLAYLSLAARKILDDAGFQSTQVLASNDLDEHIISSLHEQGAKIEIWAVGTKLVTAYDQPALGGVYKLSALRKTGGRWQHKIKLSEQAAKISTPGKLQVRRFTSQGRYSADMIFDQLSGSEPSRTMVDPADVTIRRRIPEDATYRDLLVPIFRRGRRVYEPPTIQELQATTRRELDCLYAGVKRLLNPHIYPVGLDVKLHELKTRLASEIRASEVIELH